ncbi:MAG: DUF3999 family protein [Candidatus Aureabacteria bacterium]|nr:DUF3999 family protein [Candidatus Auribacterota bacterium]
MKYRRALVLLASLIAASAAPAARGDFDEKNWEFRAPVTQVLIEGSDDGGSWRTVRRGAFLFRIGTPGNTEYEKDAVAIPENDMRYLRVTVRNGPGDPEQVALAEIRVEYRPVQPPRACPAPLAGTYVEQTGNRTILEFDLGYRHLPLRDLTISFRDANFFRRIKVSGRQDKTRIVKHAVEDAKPLEREVPEPWTPISSGALFHYSGEEGDESSPPLDLSGASDRYLRVEIANEDDPPLTFAGAEASRYLCLVRFPVPAGLAPSLFFGNPFARLPRYDLSHYAGRLAAEGLASAAFGEPLANPAFRAPCLSTPWSEKHRVILWLALLGGIVVLAVLILIQLRARKS